MALVYYSEISYSKIYRGRSYTWNFEADCQDYTANWLGDSDVAFNPGWQRLKNRRPTSAQQVATGVLDKYCPKMRKLDGPKGDQLLANKKLASIRR
tara:strand:+ start:323 stop:610 length:288 start_codon:yes stop_codon:yes gene_type:complete